MNRYFLEYSAGGAGDPWERLVVPFRTFEKASAILRHLDRSYPSCLNAHRIVDEQGRTLVAIVPGFGGEA